ncbi:hypothetical protein BAE44_0001913 [Dichanthelium oligosanthes]|uniref:Uncharacterized protein n=1 Tax=Dichanthelium oligosanthes TaxID=888268 RepID=A0A1E5WI65_9POAL|nr:hypothetical protein BAE44_0001913 [Dichanthelium oligosanthes]
MASGYRGCGSRARGGALARAAAPAPPAPVPIPDPQLADLPAADLIGHLIRRNCRGSDFVGVALVLAARERRLADAEARIRAADEAEGRLLAEIAARERSAAEATEAQIRCLVAATATEVRLQAEIHAWQRRAAEAEGRLQAYVGGRDHHEVAWEDNQQQEPALPAPVLQAELHDQGAEVGVLGIAVLTGHEEEAQVEEEGRREETPLLVVSGKRKEFVVSFEGKEADEDHGTASSKKLKLRGGRCSCAASESEANTIDEAEAEDGWEDQYALAIVPGRCDLPEASLEIGDVFPEEGTGTEPKHGDTYIMSVERGYEPDYKVSPENDPLGHGLLESSPEIAGGLKIGTEQEIGEDDQPEDKNVGDPEGFEPENLVATAVVPPGHELPPNDGVEARGVLAAGGQEPDDVGRMAAGYVQGSGDSGDEPENGVLDTEGSPEPEASRGVVSEPEASEKSTVTALAANEPPRKKGMFYKMVFKALKEKERQATASQPNLRCWLYAPLPEEPVAVEEEEDEEGLDDKDAPQQ